MNIHKYIEAEWKEKGIRNKYLPSYNSDNLFLKDIPILFIGIGGSGIDALQILKNKIDTLYNSKNTKRIEYLIIDTDALAANSNIDQEDAIIIKNADTAMLLHEAKRNSGILPNEIKSWLDKNLSPFKVMNGAAGIRQAGRLILFLNIQKVYNAIENKIKRISLDRDLKETRVMVYLFTGIGGGTGSGMFIDISYMVRKICQNAEINGMVFMPDVSCMKPGLCDVTKGNIMRNGFAALKEIDYLMMLDRYGEYFEQSYPGTVGHIKSHDPIFDYCYLIGSYESGKKAIAREEEIYSRVAEYILTEIQGKNVGSFGIESFKSNLVYEDNATASYFERYVSIGASAKYIPVDYYYSQWMCDVLTTINSMLCSAKSEEEIKSDTLDRILSGLEDIVAGEKDKDIEIEKDVKKLIAKIREEVIQKEGEYYDVKLLCCVIVEKDFKNKIKKLLNDRENGFTSEFGFLFNVPLIGRLFKKKSHKVKTRALFEKEFYNLLDINLSRISGNWTMYSEIINQLMLKCKNYNNLYDYDEFLFGTEAFAKIKETGEYKKSIEEAVNDLLLDYVKNTNRWLGRTGTDEELILLSDYVARLLECRFVKSGCTDIEKLLSFYEDGAQAKCVHFNEILKKLDDTRQLWPLSGIDTKEHVVYEIIALPQNNLIDQWAQKWKQKVTRNINLIQNQLQERFAKILFVSGYSMHTYAELKKFEDEYIKAQNRDGLHIYASEGKNWNELPSPYYETTWNNQGDEDNRQEEKKRTEDFRKIFRQAVEKHIIFFDDQKRRYCFHTDDKGNIVLKENIKPEDIVYNVGDIMENDSFDREEYIKLAADMFVHMFTSRYKIKNYLLQEG